MSDKIRIFCRALSQSLVTPVSFWGCCETLPGTTVKILILLKSAVSLLAETAAW